MARYRLTRSAKADIVSILRTSEERRGREARIRYAALLVAAMRRVAEDLQGRSTLDRSELDPGIRSFHRLPVLPAGVGALRAARRGVSAARRPSSHQLIEGNVTMKNYIQEGRMISVAAPAGGMASGDGVVVGALFGVASKTAAAGETVTIATAAA
jgi:plasmid stabilization system protein ParE